MGSDELLPSTQMFEAVLLLSSFSREVTLAWQQTLPGTTVSGERAPLPSARPFEAALDNAFTKLRSCLLSRLPQDRPGHSSRPSHSPCLEARAPNQLEPSVSPRLVAT